MGNEEVSSRGVDVHLTVVRRNDVYRLTFKSTGSLTVPCDRCLDDLDIPVDSLYELTVKYGEEYDDTGDDILILPYSRHTLDLAPVIYSTLMLAIPLQKVHEEGECNAEMLRCLDEHRSGGHIEEEEETED